MKLQTSKAESFHEVNFDHSERCEHCGKSYDVIQRAYGKGVAEHSSILGSRPSLQALQSGSEIESRHRLLIDKARLFPYQRCTECGLYGTESILLMKKEGYEIYLNRLRKIWPSSLIFFFVWLFGLVYCLVSKADAGSTILMVVLLAIFSLVAIVTRPKSRATWNHKVENINSPETVSKWLRKWNDKLAVEKRAQAQDPDIQSRRQAWKYISGIQHYLDPEWATYGF